MTDSRALQIDADVKWTPVANTRFMLKGMWVRADGGNFAGYQADFNEGLLDAGLGPWASSKEDGFGVTFRSF